MKKILIIEDDAIFASVLKTILSSKYETDTVFDGFEALKKIEQFKPDLIILDINLPKLSGFEVAKILKNNESTKNIPIIMLTALSQDINIKRGYESGCEDYLVKPFNLQHLLIKIEKYLKQ